MPFDLEYARSVIRAEAEAIASMTPVVDEAFARAAEMIKNSSIIDDCYARAAEYSAKASASLGVLPASQAKKALVSLAEYLIKRRN